MSERIAKLERALYLDGPNYTADGIVVHPESRQLLLIRRRTGEWALPGGFIDEGESPCTAAVREVAEETGIAIKGDISLAFRGVVDDPRNSETAWIETSAYICTVDEIATPVAQDDAMDARWFSLDELPPLYASHGEIVARGLEYLDIY